MATFSVDITDVVFAGTRKGYKDITITGMPEGGVTVSLTGDYATFFTYTNNPDSKGTNVYRVSTTSFNEGSSGSDRNAIFKITNTSNSKDYVNVSLTQYYTSSNRAYGKYVISNYSDIYGECPSNYTNIYFPYSLSDSTAKVELYVDGTLSSVGVPSWASFVTEATYTDTGFRRLLISCTNNNDGPRSGDIKFGSSNVGKIYQNGYPSSTSGCTQSISFLKSGGTQTIELKIPSTYNVSDIRNSVRGDYVDSLSISKISDTRLNYSVTIGTNNTGNNLRGLVDFNGGSANQYAYLGHTIITQSTEDTPSLIADPTSLEFPASGGAMTLNVTYSGTLTTSELPLWITYGIHNIDNTHRVYTLTASSNTTILGRSNDFVLSDATMSLTVPISQLPNSSSGNISVSPSSLSFSADAGYEDITFRYGGESYSIDAKEVYTWTTVSLSDVSTGLVTGTVSVATNSSTSSRRGNIYFSDGLGESVALPIEQAGISFALSAEPSSLSIPVIGGSVTTAVTYTGTLSAEALPSWLSETHTDVDANHRTYTVTATSNNSTSSRTFNWRLDDDYNHIWVYFDQAASGGVSLSISPTSNSVSSSSGSVQITVTSSGISDVQYSISDNWITYGGKNGNVYTFNYESKTSTGERTGTITFSGGGITEIYTLTQEGASAGAITVNKDILAVVNGGEYKDDRLIVTYTGKVTVSSSSWIKSIESSFNSQGSYNYKFNVDNNTEEESGGTLELRQGFIEFTGDNGTSCRVDIYQGGNTYGKRPVCIPDYTLGTYPAEGGQKYLVIDYYKKLTYTGVPSWITLNIVDGGTGATESIDDTSPVIFSVEIGKNYTSNPMEATMVFQGGDSLSLRTSKITVYQDAGFPPPPPYKPGTFKPYPKKLRYYGEGGSIRVSFTNRPEGGIGYEITYTDGSGWLSVTDLGPDKSVTATKNSGIRRRASIKFYDVNDISNYVIVPVIQGNIDGYDSIWMDDLYYPQTRDESGNYYYRLVDHNSNKELFRGIAAKPTNWVGEIGGIDIPRVVDRDIHSRLFNGGSSDWSDMNDSYITVDIYNMTESGYPGVVDSTFKYFNDWSRFEKRYDYTRSLNDPINGKGCDNMIIPFCVYYDDAATFTITDTEKNGNVNIRTLSTPSTPFVMRTDIFYDTKKLEYKQDDEVIFSYDMDHCGLGAFIYRNRFGGWDSFLIEGNIIKTDNYTKLNYRTKGEYNQMYDFRNSKYMDEKHTDNVSINTTYEAYTGWLSDEEAERLVFHLLSSPIVYFQDLHKENQLYDTDYLSYIPIRLTASSAEYKKFRNGKKLVNYLIKFEKGNIEKVRN